MAASTQLTPRGDQSGTRLAYSYREAGELIGVCERVIWQAVKNGELQAARIGRSVRIPATALADYLNRRTQVTGKPSRSEG